MVNGNIHRAPRNSYSSDEDLITEPVWEKSVSLPQPQLTRAQCERCINDGTMVRT